MFLKILIESLLAFLSLDMIWITQVASPWMKKAVPHLMAPNPNFYAAGIFYIIYLSSLIFLIISPALSQRTAMTTLAIQAFIYGFAAYATYDLTNLAVMKNYPVSMALADMVWGGILTMVTALIIYKLNT